MKKFTVTSKITKRDTKSLDRYLSDINKYELLTAEEESELAKRAIKGDKEAKELLILRNLRFVVSVAKSYQDNGIPLEDLINQGNEGLMQAAEKFDPSRGFKFISYAVWWIRQSILNHMSNDKMIRIPLNKVGDLNKINKTAELLEQQLERKPTNFEISDELNKNKPKKEHIDVFKIKGDAKQSISLNTPLGDETESCLIDVIENQDSTLEMDVFKNSDFKALAEEVLIYLNARERDVIEKTFGIGYSEPWSYEQIGEEHELSRERIRQIADKALRKLRWRLKGQSKFYS